MSLTAPFAAPAGAHVVVRDLSKAFLHGGRTLSVLRGVNFELRPGEIASVVGASGAGKSTLLHVLGTIDLPTAGSIHFDGADVTRLGAAALADFRNRQIGFVFQFHHLLPEFTALENVSLPQMIRGLSRTEAKRRSADLLGYLGLKGRLEHRPAELSGGEQQRVAIARAVANGPRLLLADEPTGNLDPSTASHVFDGLTQLVRASRLSCLIATHNHELAARMDRCITLDGGKIVEMRRQPSLVVSGGQPAAEPAPPPPGFSRQR